jgi:acetyl-CoA carboxylase carboxyl transferase alpha subunit
MPLWWCSYAGCVTPLNFSRNVGKTQNIVFPRRASVFSCEIENSQYIIEGTSSLMQMAKVSVAVEALKRRRIPFVSVCTDPTYGGVSASYAMQGDVKIAMAGARIGFAGPSVILNTVYNMNQTRYDAECPRGFQTAEYLKEHGQLDIVLPDESELPDCLGKILQVLWRSRADMERSTEYPNENPDAMKVVDADSDDETKKSDGPKPSPFEDYTATRAADRYGGNHVINRVFTNYVELVGDGRIGSDKTLQGGIALMNGQPCVVLATMRGPEHNWGMASPHGYRLALRLMDFAEHFEIPVFTIVDTVGAYPSFDSEQVGQSEAIATNLLKMASLKVPIVTLVLGEGGSGGALAIAMGNKIGMMSRAYYAVISPEGAASILGRYKDDAHKAQQFPEDCRTLANMQKIYAHQLLDLGLIDSVLQEQDGENAANGARVMSEIQAFFIKSLAKLTKLSPDQLVQHRYKKFRRMGKFTELTEDAVKQAKSSIKPASRPSRAPASSMGPQSKTLKYLADRTINSPWSAYLGKEPAGILQPAPIKPINPVDVTNRVNAKYVLDHEGPEALSQWLKKQPQVLITDTTMRDAHQSLLATRVRTVDLLACAEETSQVMKDAFSLEMWGGATYDVCYRFLNEDPWERLRLLRKKVPNICFQMLIRGANAVGYKSYPDNVVVEFIELAAKNGIDVFRIFDCFNLMDQMKLCIDSVRKVKKVAEVCICFTGDFLSPDEKIYTLDYFKNLAKDIHNAGAHILGVKDMAGLMKPQMAEPFMKAIREVTDLPVHFHTHNTSSASLATQIKMAEFGCNIIDCALASMGDTTSQPSLNAFLASLEGHPRDPKIPYLSLERLDQYWAQVRTMYSPFESGLKSGSARVFEHQIPGGQYSNLYAQCADLGLLSRWDEVLDMYRDVNRLFGDIVKVTPSSKCVGDLALFLLRNNLTCEDVRTRGETIEFPESVVELFHGDLGFPHHGFPKDISVKVLKGREPLTSRPGDSLPPADFVAERAALQHKWGPAITAEDVISSILYPKVFDDYMKWRNQFGWKCGWVDTRSFFYGLRIDVPIVVALPPDSNRENLGHLEPHTVVLKRIGPLTSDGERVLEILVDKDRRKTRVKDKAVEAGAVKVRKADQSNPLHVASPLPGVVEAIYVSLNGEVKKKDPIMRVSAMKMEVQVTAPHDGKVSELTVKVGDRVDVGSLLAVVDKKRS